MRRAKLAATPLPLNLPIPVMSSPARVEPGVFGIGNPVLLLPEGISDHLTIPQLNAVISHELCHVRRRDNLTGAIHMAVEAIFWFHPLMWWIRTRLIDERERACDEEVLRSANDPLAYAEGILNVCRLYLESPLACLSGVTGADLKRRIEFITSNRMVRNLTFGKLILLVGAGCLALIGPITVGISHPSPSWSQSRDASPLPVFEVASVKPSNEACCSSTWNSSPAGSLHMKNQTLRSLIRIAYRVKDEQISGGPKWLDSDRYNIDAKATGPTKDAQLLLMLQGLLAERFQLSFHKESKQISGFALVAAKGGLKIHPVPPSDKNQMNVRGGHMIARAVSLDRLAQMLTNLVGAPVLNESHVGEVFDFQLDWMPDDNRASGPPRGSPVEEAQSNPVPDAARPASGATDPSAGVSLVSALQDQLGLKLETRKMPTEILVIDRAEKPSEN